jgi:hypothetical protein
LRLTDAIAGDGAKPIRYLLQATSVAGFALPFSGRYGEFPSQGPLDLLLPHGEFLIEEAAARPRIGETFVSNSTEKTVTLGSRYGQIRLQAKMASGENPPAEVKPFLNLLSELGSESELPGSFSIGIRSGILPLDPLKSYSFAAGTYRILPGVSGKGIRVSSVRMNDRELQGDSLEITTGSEMMLTVILSTDTLQLTGRVTDNSGHGVARAVVALLPDNRSELMLKRSTTSDVNGRFSIDAAPGDYHLFAWYRMDGSAYLNAGFMKQYDAKGAPVRIGPDTPAPVALRPLDQRGSFD